MSDPLLIPEILRIVFDALETSSLVAAAVVCRTWSRVAPEVLWRSIRHTQTSEAFFALLRKHGHHVRSLDILLNNSPHSPNPTHIRLARILPDTPRLMNLTIGFSHEGTQDAWLIIFQVIKDYLAETLRSLALSLRGEAELEQTVYRFTPEDAAAFFPALRQLTRLELDILPTDNVMSTIIASLPSLVKVSFKEMPSPSAIIHDHFGDDTLYLLGQRLENLRDLTIKFNQRLTSAGFSRLASNCKTLTRLDLCQCHQLNPVGLEMLVEACPLLSSVTLNDSNAHDELLHKLATPARADGLRVLSIRRCPAITTAGIQNIVQRCSSLRELDFSGCPRVLIDVFTEFDWGCMHLSTLGFSGIHQQTLQEDDERPRRVNDQDLESMYRQLGRLTRLEELDMSALPFELRLFAIGRSTIENMRRLNKLDITERKEGVMDKEMIWLATFIPSLRTLRVDSYGVRRRLLGDLVDINSLLHIELTSSPTQGPFTFMDNASDAFDDTDESDDSEDSEYSGSSEDSEGSEDLEGSEDADDSDDAGVSEDPQDSDDSDDSGESEAIEDTEDSEDFGDSENTESSRDSEDSENKSTEDSENSNESSDPNDSADELSRHLQGTWIGSDSDTSDSSEMFTADGSDSFDSEISDASDHSEDSGSESGSGMEGVDGESGEIEDDEESDDNDDNGSDTW
ncbi:hypothetical protein BGZ65_011360 [Modicella reniformis]|uniref:F-box domain-containing protein n=1 Tax=Modicella reniformis TaxID=1440133 RepID=A0A9P6SUS9_9FUNG|nr:hypothetical protein BGZ65_011360 [Modicella reniformis]